MLEIIIVRHGETDSNKKGTYLGWTDIELNEEGIRQAGGARDRLKGEKIDMILSSPLKRTRQTAEIINENFNLDIEYFESLKERNFGIWDNLTYREVSEKYPEECKAWAEDWMNYCVEVGESHVQMGERVKNFLDKLVAGKENGKILIVTHLGCAKMIILHLLCMPLEDYWRFSMNNAGIVRIEVNDEKYAYLTMLNG